MSKVTHVRGPVGSPHAFLATPTYTGKIDASQEFSLLYSLRRLEAAGMGWDRFVESGNCHVDDARNSALRAFLQTDCTDLVFIDSDVSWFPADLEKLLRHDCDIVAGVYPKRQEGEPFPVMEGMEWDGESELVEVIGAPTGFMRIRRHVVEKLVEANKHRQFLGQAHEAGDDPYTIVFERTYEDGHRWSGDYAFCQKWRKVGGSVYVDPYMHLTHVGEKEFSGSLADYWTKKQGLSERKFDQTLQKLKAEGDSEEIFLELFKHWGNEFAASPALLRTCYGLARGLEGRILETGSGLSSMVMATANPSVQVHCLEHDAYWASRTAEALERNGIGNVHLHHAPLKDYEGYRWYDLKNLPEGHFDMVLCDGPPRKKGARKGLFLNCTDRINGGIVLMDDADDSTQTAAITEWSEQNGRQVKVVGQARPFAISYKENK